MNILKANYINPSMNIVREAYRILENCGLVVGITDTLYGIFADPFRDECVSKVYVAKKRSRKPIPLLASSPKAVFSITDADHFLQRFLETIWPGPITVVLKPMDNMFSEKIHLGTGKIGFRVPASPLPRKLAQLNGGFITGTSANISGLKPARNIDEAIKQLGNNVDLYIDSGTAPIGEPSTVIDLTSEKPIIVRDGAVSYRSIIHLYKHIVLKNHD
ncbi:L-threonylcarbamoyladenylate synthase [Staphylothermus hellenicus]|uniref:L-threonylcarbamoyladenylate synthase n=1 Tax=Staphylothermus hellenicus (strain DSM 12710 / JCM 10830 / BK20S6-10-b1 / P8) TaxID=591019 RepID=D7DB48_STAHD|nr:L-threonylcarbamoyladenylate synthase [Staphylothermus hellenicus]ADI31395.1 Sua5/YciO/YrdC/YwlC family protein [Staphylothermus hellenicus DSM 12710]